MLVARANAGYSAIEAVWRCGVRWFTAGGRWADANGSRDKEGAKHGAAVASACHDDLRRGRGRITEDWRRERTPKTSAGASLDTWRCGWLMTERTRRGESSWKKVGGCGQWLGRAGELVKSAVRKGGDHLISACLPDTQAWDRVGREGAGKAETVERGRSGGPAFRASLGDSSPSRQRQIGAKPAKQADVRTPPDAPARWVDRWMG